MSSLPAEGGRKGRGAALVGNPYLLLTFTMLCWGGNAVAGRLAVPEVSPMVLTAARWLFVVLLMACFARRQILRDWPVLRRHLPLLAAMGALGFTSFNALFYVAAYSTTAVNIGIIQGSIPVFVLLGAFLLYRTPVRGLQLAGVIVTIVGVLLVATKGEIERLLGLTFALGDLLMVIACALYAGYTLALRRRPQVSFLSFFAIMALSAFVTTLPLMAIEAAMGQTRAPSLAGIAILAYVGIFPSFLAQIAFMRGVSLIGPGRAGIFVNLVPVFASILAVVVLGEPFEFFQLGALALVLGGIALAERGKRG